MATCRSCRDWHVRPDDTYCSACGQPLLDFEVLDATNLVPVERTGETIEVRVRVRNTGQASLELKVPAQPDKRVARFTNLPQTLRVRPGAEAEFAFEAEFLWLSEENQGEIREIPIESTLPGLRKFIRFYRPSEPEIETIAFGPIQAGQPWLLKSTDPVEARLEVSNRGGWAADIAWDNVPPWLRFEAPWVRVPALSTVDIPCSILPEEAASGRDPATDFEGTFDAVIGKANGTDSQAAPFATMQVTTAHFVMVDPPRPGICRRVDKQVIELGDTIDLEQIMPTERLRRRFELYNSGGTELPLVGIYTSLPADDAALIAAFDEPLTRLAPGSRIPFHLCVDGAAHAKSGQHNFPLVFDFGPCGTMEVRIHFDVAKLTPYRGVVALDFGTSNSCIACCEDTTQKAAQSLSEGGAYLPSVIYFLSPEDYVVGEDARKYLRGNPLNGVAGIKRALLSGERTIQGRSISPEELVGVLMREMVAIASRHLVAQPTRVVVTVPVGFGQRQRQIIREAASKAAGVRGVMVVDEPSAAAMHFCFNHPEYFRDVPSDKPKNVLVFDFGGGTLDVAILAIHQSGFDILMRRGDARLGGMDLDRLVSIDLVQRVQKHPDFGAFEKEIVLLPRQKFAAKYARNSSILGGVRYHFNETAERTKIALSNEKSIDFEFASDLLVDGAAQRVSRSNRDGFKGKYTREELAHTIDDRVQRSLEVVGNALEVAGLTPGDIDFVLLTGQVCNTVCIRDAVRAHFPNTIIPEKEEFDLKACVSLGAAQLALAHGGAHGHHMETGVGKIGYIDRQTNMFRPMFVEVLPERHPYGQATEKPIPVQVDEDGVGIQTIHQNLQLSDEVVEGDQDFVALGQVCIHRPDKRGQTVDLILALDEQGNLKATVDGESVDIEFPPTDVDEEY